MYDHFNTFSNARDELHGMAFIVFLVAKLHIINALNARKFSINICNSLQIETAVLMRLLG